MTVDLSGKIAAPTVIVGVKCDSVLTPDGVWIAGVFYAWVRNIEKLCLNGTGSLVIDGAAVPLHNLIRVSPGLVSSWGLTKSTHRKIIAYWSRYICLLPLIVGMKPVGKNVLGEYVYPDKVSLWIGNAAWSKLARIVPRVEWKYEPYYNRYIPLGGWGCLDDNIKALCSATGSKIAIYSLGTYTPSIGKGRRNPKHRKKSTQELRKLLADLPPSE